MERFDPRKMVHVVESHDDVREALCAMLREAGHLVTSSASGEKALASLGLFESVGLILVDWGLPEMSGGDFLAELRRHPRLAWTPVVALTMDDQEKPAGVQGCVLKPDIDAQVLEFVRRYCGSPNGWDGHTGGAMA